MSKIKVTSRDEADRALQRIGQLQIFIEQAEATADKAIAAAREILKEETAVQRAALAENLAALEGWAKADAKNWAPSKSLDLVFGSLGFRLPPPAIRFKLSVENVIARLKANRGIWAIRVKEEVDKEALASWSDEDLEKIGCKRTKPKDSFWCEPKREVVK